MINYLKENWSAILTVLFPLAIGILLLVDPAVYATAIIRIGGILLGALGAYDLVKYFRAEPEEAAAGSGFASGSILVTAGLFCVFGGGWFVHVFPQLAVLYGAFQVLLGYRKMQRAVDALRVKNPEWQMKAISAGITLLFGLIVTVSPNMGLMSIWVFTGIALIIEGLFDGTVLWLQYRKNQEARPSVQIPIHAEVTISDDPEPVRAEPEAAYAEPAAAQAEPGTAE